MTDDAARRPGRGGARARCRTRSPTAGTASPGTRAGWCSSGMRSRARSSEPSSPRADPSSRFLRADAVEVLTPSADRVAPRCAVSRVRRLRWLRLPARLAAAAAPAARRRRQRAAAPAGGHRPTRSRSRPLPGDDDGLGWRTRVRFARSRRRPPGLARASLARGHPGRPLPDRASPICPTSTAALQAGAESAEAVGRSTGERVVVTDPRDRSDDHRDARRADAGRSAQATSGRCILVQPTPWSMPCSTGVEPSPAIWPGICTPGSACSRRRWPSASVRPARWSRSSRTARIGKRAGAISPICRRCAA